MSTLTSGSSSVTYAYDENNRRIERNASSAGGNDEIYFYAPDGRLLSAFAYGFTAPLFQRVYFGSMLIGATSSAANSDTYVLTDRLGTAAAGYAYGTDIESPGTGWDEPDFATYTVEFAGLEYANQRFYTAGYGRFMTPDSATAGNAVSLPGNWNKYAYVGGDPVNKTDPLGFCSPQDEPPCYPVDVTSPPIITLPPEDDSQDPDSDIALPQISGAASANQGVIHWVKLVQKRLAVATGKALEALQKQACAKLFGIADPSSLLSGLIQNDTRIGGINSPSGYTVSATTEGTTLVTPNGTFNGAEIKINDLAGTFVTGTLNDQIVTLLHELGHAVNFIYGNGTSQIVNDGTALGEAGVQASIDNTALVKKNCLPVK